MFLIKYRLQGPEGNIMREEILPEVFDTPAECDHLIVKMTSRFQLSDYDIVQDRWWARAGSGGETHYWWRSPIMDIRDENIRTVSGS
jgi:hypothetical protein